MPENEIEQPQQELVDEPRRKWLTPRNFAFLGVVLIAGVVLASLLLVFLYRYGTFNRYVENEFTATMYNIGVVFDAEVFELTANPLELHIQNATFNDKITGEKLFFVHDARIGLSIRKVFAWQLSSDIGVDTTDIDGLEVWVEFDENGKSNYSNVTFVEEEGGVVNLRYDTVTLKLRNGLVHVGQESRKISGDAKNVTLDFAPEDPTAEKLRYKVFLTSTDSNFVYDESVLEPINLWAKAIIYTEGAEINELKIESPIGTVAMTGTVTDWVTLTYQLHIESTVDLTQTSDTFPLESTLRGVANFNGTVSGQGETYQVEGTADSQALSVEGVYLKAVNVEGTVAGTNKNYVGHGTAVAELLTFNDFRIDFPRLTGNIRGTGTDFRWVGDLQAAAVKSGSMTIGQLFLSDAVADFNDNQMKLAAAKGTAQLFSVAGTEFEQMALRNLLLQNQNGVTTVTADSLSSQTMAIGENSLSGLNGNDLSVKTGNGQTDVTLKNLTADSSQIAGADVRDLSAGSFSLKDRADQTDMALNNVAASDVTTGGAHISGVESPAIEISDRPAETLIYSDSLRVAKIVTGGAELGSLNIGGVRLSIREGRIEGKTNDIDAGTIALLKTETLPDGGYLDSVKLVTPVFVVEDSGRYRASADMSIGGGIIGSVELGPSSAKVDINNDRVALNELNAIIMDGTVTGNATIAFNSATQSQVAVDFQHIDLAKLIAVQSAQMTSINGQTSGSANLTFQGTDVKSASGTINATITASAGSDPTTTVPLAGKIDLTATNGLVNVDNALLKSEKSEVTATGRFDLKGNDSNLNFAMTSTDAAEIDRFVRTLDLAPDLVQQFDEMEVEFAGAFAFNGTITGNIADPTLNGNASLQTVLMHGQELGSIRTAIYVSPVGIELTDGLLAEKGGGNATFSAKIPYGGTNNISFLAKLNGIDAKSLMAAIPYQFPERLRDLSGPTTGSVDLSGLPGATQGSIDILTTKGMVGGNAFDTLTARAEFQADKVVVPNIEVRIGEGSLAAKGVYDRTTDAFVIDVTSKSLPLPLAFSFFPEVSSIAYNGTVDLQASATGTYGQPSTYDVEFSGLAHGVVINENAFGAVKFEGTTNDGTLSMNMTAVVDGKTLPLTATIKLSDENLPYSVVVTFDQSPLGPFFAMVPQLKGVDITGVGTGVIEFSGNLSNVDSTGKRNYSTENLTGKARFSELALRIEDSPLAATKPVIIDFDPNKIDFISSSFAGGGSNMTIAGTLAIADTGVNDLSIDGTVNLSLLNAFDTFAARDTFFGGFADVAVKLVGPYLDKNLTGSALLENASIATFIGSDRITLEKMNGRIMFEQRLGQNQAQFEKIKGVLGGGEFSATGGAMFTNALEISQYRVSFIGRNVTIPYPPDFTTTGDAAIEILEEDVSDDKPTSISGNIRASRAFYSKDIDLATLVGGRTGGSLSTSTPSLSAPTLDLTIEGRNALVVENNIALLSATISLKITGNADDPQITGRIVAEQGQILFRNERYDIQRAVVVFPQDAEASPLVSLQAETEIAGYQIYVNVNGPLDDTEQLNVSVRSSPALPQADVVSLITTGNLSNTESGIPTIAQGGINTVAEALTDSIINKPIRKATDRLFGLNVFEIDPIISGQTLGPSARLTVGRQINNNLKVTYSTNLSQDQNQVLAFEYRVSNSFSFVAMYEQRSLTNVTHSRNNFSFGVRFRRRF